MKLVYFLMGLISFSLQVNGQENQSRDERRIYFYLSDSTITKKAWIAKTLGRFSDSLLISDVELTFDRGARLKDTISCNYTRNMIIFNRVDTTINKIANVSISFTLNLKKRKNDFKERLTIPFKILFEQTNENSSISISFERKRNNLYYISISKLDFPFITSSLYITSEVLNLYK